MIPKVENCLHAARLGVPAQIVDGRAPGALRTLEGAGTVVRP
jgi:acetylglutamate kinase